MSSATTPDLQDRVQTITDALVAFNEDRGQPVFALDTEDVAAIDAIDRAERQVDPGFAPW